MREYTTSITANLCSFARAYHSNFVPKKIFNDYLSFDLMGKELYENTGLLIQNKFQKEKFDINESLNTKAIKNVIHEFLEPIPLSRIAFFEQELHLFAKKHGKIQYVICGAGFDSFGFRNDNDDIKVFEIDHPNTQSFKKNRIKTLEWNAKKINFVPVDFSKDDMNEQLLKKGFNPEVPTFFAIPGVSYYLTLPVLENTIKKISELCMPPTMVCLDFPDETTFRRSSTDRVSVLAQITEQFSEKMTGTYSVDEIEKMLSRHGYKIEKHLDPQRIEKEFFEGKVEDLHAFENVHFITAGN